MVPTNRRDVVIFSEADVISFEAIPEEDELKDSVIIGCVQCEGCGEYHEGTVVLAVHGKDGRGHCFDLTPESAREMGMCLIEYSYPEGRQQ
jgi:hypothetical protein